MDKIILEDILRLKEENSPVRCKFNTSEGSSDPYSIYVNEENGKERINTNWLLNRKYNKKDGGKEPKWFYTVGTIALSFISIDDDRWLLTTVKKITKRIENLNNEESYLAYEAEEIEKYRKYFGRLVIKFHKKGQTYVRIYESILDELELSEILVDAYTGKEFPGYENVDISYLELKSIISNNKPSWKTALKNQKAVYLIRDKKTGKMYVGSATSENGMIWSRWSTYADNGHGSNILLKKLVEKEKMKYIEDNFYYSILENYNGNVDDDYILKRESWWKEILFTRENGYNDN